MTFRIFSKIMYKWKENGYKIHKPDSKVTWIIRSLIHLCRPIL